MKTVRFKLDAAVRQMPAGRVNVRKQRRVMSGGGIIDLLLCLEVRLRRAFKFAHVHSPGRHPWGGSVKFETHRFHSHSPRADWPCEPK